MVKKLFKHEIRSYLRVFIPVYLILLGIALLGRVIQFFETETTAYTIIAGSSLFAFYIALCATMVMSVVLAIVRYYRNLFTGEGYLTFTLPVTTNQLLLVKLFTAMFFEVISLIVAAVSLCIYTAGDLLTEIGKAGAYLFDKVYDKLGGHFWGYLAEGIVLLVVAAAAGFLLYYLCICIGQLFNKNRVLAAFGIYAAFYFGTQILATIVMVVGIALYEIDLLPLEAIEKFMETHPYATAHIVLCGLLVVYAVLALVYYLISRSIIKRRLNLE